MTSDRRLQSAIEAGERNLATMELVRNWCAHVRVEKFGGVGMVEQATGLPIGHHSLACDHAGSGKMSTWDIRDAALDFYDRNCVDCKLRKPVGFPNLTKLVKARDDERLMEDGRNAAAADAAAGAHAARRATRDKLRSGLTALSNAIVDHIDDFDEYRDAERRERLCESARLAPEHFAPAIVEYVFDLAERERWFAEAGLTILHHLRADPVRLARLALVSMGHAEVTRMAVPILLDLVPEVEPALIANALPAIVEVASPDDGQFFMEHRPPAEPELLKRLWLAHPGIVRDCLDQMLASRSRYVVELGARGVLVLEEHVKGTAGSFAREMISKFVRAGLLLDDFDDERGGFRYLRDAIVRAFLNAPDTIDGLIQEYMAGSDAKSREHGFKLYDAALRSDRFGDVIPENSRLHRIAFGRLVWAATTENGDKVLRLVQGVFQGGPYALKGIARAELDSLLGAVLLLDDRLRRHDETPNDAGADFLQVLERGSRRTTFISLMSSYLEWASQAADGDPVLIKKIVGLFDTIPEGRDDLKGAILNSFEHLAETVEGLALILPHLYYGLVGPSAIVRSYCATAFGEAPHATRENVPPLVFEAFALLLRDSFIVVHTAAARALQRFQLPESLRGEAAASLLNLIRYYAKRKEDWHFVVDCIDTLSYELHRTGTAKGKIGRYLVTVLLEAETIWVKSEIRSFARTLGETEGFADLVIRLLPEVDDDSRRSEEMLDALASLQAETVFERRAEFERVGKQLAPRRPWIACHVIEALGRGGAWVEARRVAEAGVEGHPATVENRSRRIYSQSLLIAARLEEAVADGRGGESAIFHCEWQENKREQQEQDDDVRRRNSRSGFSYPG